MLTLKKGRGESRQEGIDEYVKQKGFLRQWNYEAVMVNTWHYIFVKKHGTVQYRTVMNNGI